VDAVDGVTPVTNLVLSTATGSAILHDTSTIVDIGAYTFNATSASGYYQLTLQAGITNIIGHLTVDIQDESLIRPLRSDFTILEEVVYDRDYATGSTGEVDLSSASIDLIWDEVVSKAAHDVAQSAAKLLRQIEGLVLHDGQLVTAGTSSIQFDADASDVDDFYNNAKVLAANGGTGGSQERVIVDYDGATRVAAVAPDWIIIPSDGADFQVLPASDHAQTHGADYRESGLIFIATTGSVESQSFVDGTDRNPIVDTAIVSARSVADDLNLTHFHMEPGASITLNQAYEQWQFEGNGYTVNLNNQNIRNSRFIQGAIVGTGTATSGRVVFISCNFVGPGSTLPSFVLLECRLTNTITLADTGDHLVDRCFSNSPGAAFDFNSTGNTTIGLTHWSGDIEIKQLGVAGTDAFSINGQGTLTINANCVGGTVTVKGNIEVVDNSGGAVTILQNANSIPNNNASASWEEQSSLHQTDGTAGAGILSGEAVSLFQLSALGIVTGSAVTGTLSLTEMTTDLTEDTNDHYIGRTLIWTTSPLKGQGTPVTDYDGVEKRLVFDPVTDTPLPGAEWVMV
jgi:hypothetical protein